MEKATDIALDAIVRCKRMPYGRTRNRLLRDAVLELCVALEQNIKEIRSYHMNNKRELPSNERVSVTSGEAIVQRARR